MATYTVSDDVLHSALAEEYWTKRADRRTLIGLRQTLEMLGIPLPAYAVRRPSGPSLARGVLVAFHADHPEQGPMPSRRYPGTNPSPHRPARAG